MVCVVNPIFFLNFFKNVFTFSHILEKSKKSDLYFLDCTRVNFMIKYQKHNQKFKLFA